MAKYNVVLVAGHDIDGDPGAVGQGTTEAKETVQIVDRVNALLQPHKTVGVDVVPHTLDYVDSTNWINARYKWDNSDTIVVEVHLNSHSSKASGTETFVGIGGLAYPETKRMASSIQNAMVQSIGLPNRGVKEGNFYLIQSTNPLACLLEVRFINKDSNSDTADAKAATGIANGICDFFKQARPDAKTTTSDTTESRTAMVKRLYLAVLERPAKAEGLAHYVTGYSKNMTEAQIIADMKKSPEYKDLLAKKAADKKAAEKAAADKLAAEKKAAADKLAAEKKKAADKLAAEKKAQAEAEAIALQLELEQAEKDRLAEEALNVKPDEVIDYSKENNGILKTILDLLKKLLSVFNTGGK